eukprot:SAG31_NODE_25199_length_466_cov_0.831063_1_plen_40_part_10
MQLALTAPAWRDRAVWVPTPTAPRVVGVASNIGVVAAGAS